MQDPNAEAHALRARDGIGVGGLVAASTAIGARPVQRLHRDRGLTLQAGAAALRRRQLKVARQARELLAPVYGWLTEGFDTLDRRKLLVLCFGVLKTGKPFDPAIAMGC